MKNGYTLSGARILFVSLIFGLCFVGEVWGQTTYYSQQTGDFNTLGNWNSQRGGGGDAPTTFSDNTFVIQSGHTMTTSTDVPKSESVDIEAGSIAAKLHEIPTNVAIIRNGGTLQQRGGVITTFGQVSTEFEIDSLVEQYIGTFTATFTYGNLSFISGSSTHNANLDVRNNLTVNGATLNGAGASSPTHRIDGDLIVASGTFRGTNGNGNSTFNIGGSVNHSGGTFTGSAAAGNSTFNIEGSLTRSAGTYTAASSTGRPTYNLIGSGGVVSLGSVADARHFINIDGQRSLGAGLPVDADGVVTVNGWLECGSEIVSGTGSFTLASGGTLSIGHASGIATTAAEGNIQTTGGRTFSSEASYVYNGANAQITGSGLPSEILKLEIDNGNGVTLSQEVAVTNILTLSEGIFALSENSLTLSSDQTHIATITNGDGSVDGDITYERLYHLEQSGWRMISSPFSGVDFSTLRDSGFHTQGEDVEWAEFEEGDRLLYVFNATTQDWDAVSGADAPFAAGTGYIFYMFKDDADGSPVLPNRWVIEGTENAEFTHNLVFNSAVEVESFNLVSNPHAGNLDFEELTMTNVGAYYAVWDPDGVPGGGVDGYRYFNWPSQTGTAGAFIAPFQAFVVEATDENPSITFNYNMKANTDAQEVIGKQSASRPSPHVRLFLEGEGLLERETYMIFDERASSEPELFRVPRFSSLTSDHASVSFVGPNDRLLAFDGAWPTDGTTTFDLAMQTTKPGTYVLRWPTWYDIPEVWSFILVDHLAGREINMRDAGEYAFESGDAMLSKGDAVEMGRIISASLNETARFSIVVEATTTSTDPGADLPATFALHAAYPNPFNPATQVAYDVPEQAFVRVAVYDAVGRQVAVLAAHEHAAGEHRLTWHAAGMASGLYFVRMETAGRVLTRSVTLLR